MYELAIYFKEWNVEQEGGLKYRMTVDQFWTWMEWNRLTDFLERGDRNTAKILSKLHNVNVSEVAHMREPGDFMPKSVDEIIQEEEKSINEPDIKSETLSFNQYVANLKSLGKPIQTIKV